MIRHLVVRDKFMNIVYEDYIDYTSEEDLDDIYEVAEKLNCSVSLLGGV